MKKIILMFTIIFCTISAQVLLKFASFQELYSFTHLSLIIISITVYGVGFVLSPMIYRLMPISQVIPIISISSITTAFLVGYFVFGEKVLPKDILAIALAIVAIFILAGRGAKK